MHKLTPEGQAVLDELSRKHGFTGDAVRSMLESVLVGQGRMAQFQHAEFGGSGQWMAGGMIMTSDMFNNALKARIGGLCTDLANLVASRPELTSSASFQSQTQSPSLFVSSSSHSDWWGPGLGRPSSTGAQNDVRYAWFPQERRLAIEIQGHVTVYDSLDHQIGGFSQQQSGGASLTFTSQHGTVPVSSLPVVSGQPPQREPEARTPPAATPPAGVDIFATLEKLAELHGRGILTDEEFSAKKAELLSRL